MARGLRAQSPSRERRVAGGGADDVDAPLAPPEWEKEPGAQAILAANRSGPDDVTRLICTSGAADEPKGVMHTASTLMANIVPYAEPLNVILTASRMAHQTDFMYGLMMPIMLKAGADIAAMADQDYVEAYGSNFITCNWDAIRTVRKPVIASVAGLVPCGGCELALSCDVIVAARSAKSPPIPPSR